MKGLRINEEELSCLIEDAIIHKNDSYSRIIGNSTKGFTIEKPQKVDNIEKKMDGANYIHLWNKTMKSIA